MKRKTPKLSNLLFAGFLLLLIIPQTRTPIQVAVNKLKLLVWSPSKLDVEDQTQLEPFSYQLMDLNDTPKTIEIGSGKATFISYWATWCPPCIAELPSIEKLYTDYGAQVNFILITNEDSEVVTRFLEKKGYDLPVFISRMRTPDALYDNSIPTNYIIDGTGKIIIKETGAADWDSEKVRIILEGVLPSAFTFKFALAPSVKDLKK